MSTVYPFQPTVQRVGSARSSQRPLVSVIVPFFNESSALPLCHSRIERVLIRVAASHQQPCELIYVDDGSSDASWDQLQRLLGNSQTVRRQVSVHCLRLSRNFGKEAAMCAGLQRAQGQTVVLLDADLQDPPELIPDMLRHWRKGYDVVDMQRKTRHGEGWLKCVTAQLYYKLMNRLSDIPIPENVGDFRLMDRKVVDQINQLPERTRFMKGLFAWPGFRRTTLQFERDPRVAGETKWRYSKLLHLAFEGITSFSTKPLRMATIAGLLASGGALVLASLVIGKTLMYGDPVAGYPSLISVVLLLGGVQLLSIGVMGEYVGRLFIEAKQRPLYVVMDDTSFHAAQHWQEADL